MKNIPEDIAPILDELKLRLREFYGERLVKLVLFGSRARGDNEPDSDIDVLVVLDIPGKELNDLAYPTEIVEEILDRYNQLVSIVEVDIGRFGTLKSPLMINVRREGVQVA